MLQPQIVGEVGFPGRSGFVGSAPPLIGGAQMVTSCYRSCADAQITMSFNVTVAVLSISQATDTLGRSQLQTVTGDLMVRMGVFHPTTDPIISKPSNKPSRNALAII